MLRYSKIAENQKFVYLNKRVTFLETLHPSRWVEQQRNWGSGNVTCSTPLDLRDIKVQKEWKWCRGFKVQWHKTWFDVGGSALSGRLDLRTNGIPFQQTSPCFYDLKFRPVHMALTWTWWDLNISWTAFLKNNLFLNWMAFIQMFNRRKWPFFRVS